jgi:hypothetical protein
MAKTIPADEKVFMVSKTTNTTYSGSAALKAMNEWYTMDDVTNTVRPYQVFTALLTQSGGNTDGTAFGTDYIYKGQTYTIVALNPGDSLIPYGAPNNEIGTSFICNQGTFDWGDSASELSFQEGAPVATVLENTIGNVWFIYNDVGNYSVNSNGLFTLNKSLGLISTLPLGVGDGSASSLVWQTIDTFKIENGLIAGIAFDTILFNTPIEIRVYS